MIQSRFIDYREIIKGNHWVSSLQNQFWFTDHWAFCFYNVSYLVNFHKVYILKYLVIVRMSLNICQNCSLIYTFKEEQQHKTHEELKFFRSQLCFSLKQQRSFWNGNFLTYFSTSHLEYSIFSYIILILFRPSSLFPRPFQSISLFFVFSDVGEFFEFESLITSSRITDLFGDWVPPSFMQDPPLCAPCLQTVCITNSFTTSLRISSAWICPLLL